MKTIRVSPLAMFLAILGLLLLAGCSGSGGGGGDESGPTASASTDSGTVALYLKDGPAESDEIWITITKVALIPMPGDDEIDDDDDGEDLDGEAFDDDGEDLDGDNEGDAAAPVVIFESEEGERVDLLNYEDDPYLFLVDDAIPAGEYAKIRLWISAIDVVGGSCEDVYVKLPSGKIDLNPQGGFEVVPGEALAIELDVDLEKSIQMHPAGQSGKCIFRPVIFVDIYDEPALMPRCPRIISGTIASLIVDEADETLVVGFEMALSNAGDHKKPVTVMLDDATIFDGQGNLVEANDLAAAGVVNVRGKLNSEGALEASLVVVGDVAMVSGLTLGAVDDTDVFQLDPDDDQDIVDLEGPLNVQVLAGAFVLIGCDGEVDASAIQEGMESLVVGKITTGGEFLAVLVVLRPLEVSGALVDMVSESGGSELTVKVDPDDAESPEVHVFLPDDVWPHLKGDGLLPLGLLAELVACDIQPFVEIKLDAEMENVAVELAVAPMDLSGVVIADADPDDDRLTLDIAESDADLTIQISAFPTILDGNGLLVAFADITPGDTIVAHGLASCDEGIAQIAFVISIQPPLPNIVERARAADNLETLVAAVEAADLVDTLAGTGPLTVFAPTDAAFDNLPEGVLDDLLADSNALAALLSYHVYDGTLFAAEAVALDGATVVMLNGLGMTIDVVDENVVLNLDGSGEATVIVTDIVASNGVIHVIDAVLDPEEAPST